MVCTALAVCASGCASKQKAPLQAPDAQVSLTHFSGGVLSGPTTRVADTSHPEAAIAVSVRLVAMEQPLPADLLKPIDPGVRLIVSNRADTPVVPVMHLTRGIRWSGGGQNGGSNGGDNRDVAQLESKLAAGALSRSAEMQTVDLAVPPGVTAVLAACDQHPGTTGTKRGIELSLHAEPSPADHQLQLSIAVEDHARELAVLQSIPVTEATSIALMIPFRYSDGRSQAVLALIHASPGTESPELQAALARCAADLARSASEASARSTRPAPGAAALPGFEASLAALEEPGSRRAGLVYLASETDAPVCGDCALVCDDMTLGQLAQQVRQRATTTAATTQPTTESLGWALDAAALSLMSELQSDNKLPPELLAVFIRHAGQAALNGGLVQEIVSGAGARMDFEQRVQAENFVALEDSSPGARVRAFDWLSAQGKAPGDYDPLASPKERRAALSKALDAMASQTSAAGTSGGKP
jgi:hypothetical protein